MTVRIEHDATAADVATVRANVRRYGGAIVQMNPVGPGGGNPQFVIDLPTDEVAAAYLANQYPDDPLTTLELYRVS